MWLLIYNGSACLFLLDVDGMGRCDLVNNLVEWRSLLRDVVHEFGAWDTLFDLVSLITL